MLTKEQIDEIREHLNRAQNPLFFFDNDPDGLASFLLLRRYTGRGKGVVIKSFPDLNSNYLRKVQELNPDYIFVLDKPSISKEFLEEIKKMNLPLVWIDHHNVARPEDKDIFYFNPFYNDRSNEPVAYLSYNIANKKEDCWIALIGCISDGFLPDFIEDFKKVYPELWKENIKTAFDALYCSEIGKIARILGFSLKDRTSRVVSMLKFLNSVNSPYDILDEEKAYAILQRFNQVNSRYSRLVEKAKKFSRSKVLFFQYGGGLSLSSDISNELLFLFPEKVIVVAYINGAKANVSLRWKGNIREATIKAIEGLEGATGGGHEHATGAQVSVEDLPKFKDNIIQLVGN